MDGMLLALVLTAAGIAVLLSGWSWLRPGEPKQSEPRWVQPAVLALIAAVGLAWALWLRSTVNPHWLPVGQDAWDFLAYPLSYLDSDLGHRTDTRHPLAPWLAVQLFERESILTQWK